MRVDGIKGADSQISGVNLMQTNDSFSKMIQSQIANAQEQLQKLSENNDMSVEEKMKRRQEIQQQITDLDHQLRQHQIVQRRANQGKDNVIERNLSTKRADKSGKGAQQGMRASTMRVIISADAAMSQAQVQSSVATRMEGRAGVLEAEIKQDSANGKSVESKQEDLIEVQQKLATTETSQMNVLSVVNKRLEEATDAEGDDSIDLAEKKLVGTREEEAGTVDEIKGDVSKEMSEITETEVVPSQVVYSHVDVKL